MELIVAMALVGIVMVGTVSVDFAVNNMRKSTADSSGVALRTAATMIDITNNVSRAVGDAQNIGIQTDNTNGVCTLTAPCRSWFCARQDGNPPDPNVYTDDSWICYWKPDTDTNIYKCPRTFADGPGPCTTGDEIIGTAACETANCGNSNYLFTFSLTNDPVARMFSFDINLKNRAYPTQLQDPLKPMKNPEYELKSHITPMGHSY